MWVGWSRWGGGEEGEWATGSPVERPVELASWQGPSGHLVCRCGAGQGGGPESSGQMLIVDVVVGEAAWESVGWTQRPGLVQAQDPLLGKWGCSGGAAGWGQLLGQGGFPQAQGAGQFTLRAEGVRESGGRPHPGQARSVSCCPGTLEAKWQRDPKCRGSGEGKLGR